MNCILKNLSSRIASKIRQEGIIATIKRAFTLLWASCFTKENFLSPVDRALIEITKDTGFVIVQLGSYIGNSPNDPLFRKLAAVPDDFDCKVILVEPNKLFFDQLTTNYSNKRFITCENVAVAPEIGEVTLYTLGVNPIEFGYPEWLSQLSSLRKDRMGELWERYEQNLEYQKFYREHLIEQQVMGIPFDQLLAKHGITNIDVLQVDVEGSELAVLRSIDFEMINIRFLNYERVLLGNERLSAERLLSENGFLLIDHGQDTFAFKEKDSELFDRWLK